MQMYENYPLDYSESSSVDEDEPKTERKREPNKKAQSLIKIKSTKKGFAKKFLKLNKTKVC